MRFTELEIDNVILLYRDQGGIDSFIDTLEKQLEEWARSIEGSRVIRAIQLGN